MEDALTQACMKNENYSGNDDEVYLLGFCTMRILPGAHII